jgi:hypothetical protein
VQNRVTLYPTATAKPAQPQTTHHSSPEGTPGTTQKARAKLKRTRGWREALTSPDVTGTPTGSKIEPPAPCTFTGEDGDDPLQALAPPRKPTGPRAPSPAERTTPPEPHQHPSISPGFSQNLATLPALWDLSAPDLPLFPISDPFTNRTPQPDPPYTTIRSPTHPQLSASPPGSGLTPTSCHDRNQTAPGAVPPYHCRPMHRPDTPG